jgi:hypothetical protein
MKLTKKMYEDYLNEVMEKESPRQLSIKDGTYIRNPGTYMRVNDWMQFEVGYQEWVRETRNS